MSNIFILGGATVFISLVTDAASIESTKTQTQTKTAGARQRQSSLMKYGSLEFKGSTVGVVKRTLRDGDVSRSFMTLE